MTDVEPENKIDVVYRNNIEVVLKIQAMILSDYSFSGINHNQFIELLKVYGELYHKRIPVAHDWEH